MRLSLFGFSVFIAVILSFASWGLNTHFSPGPLKSNVRVVIPSGIGLSQITRILTQRGVLNQPFAFKLAVKLLGESKSLRAGEYFFEAQSSPNSVLEKLSSGNIILRQLTIPEGLTSLEVIKKLDQTEGLIGQVSVKVPEGTLLPETYNYKFGDTKNSILLRMQKEMLLFVENESERRRINLPLKSKEDVITLASIIEKEAGMDSERDIIASVFVNRLNKKMKLQSDPTVRYGVRAFAGNKRLTHKDLNRETKHNTYKIYGLPPTPICNPGKASIIAALSPASTDFFYFVANGSGGHFFSKTLKEHNQNVAKWRKIRDRL